MENSEVSKRVFSFIAGLSIGAVVAALWAPKSGAELRDGISEGVADRVDDLRRSGRAMKGKVQRIANDAKERVNEAKDRVAEAVEAGTATYERAKNSTE